MDLLMAPIGNGRMESRDLVNATWEGVRSLALALNVLVVSATQAPARAYGVDVLLMEHFSEDKRKNAHVTDMIGINRTDDEAQIECLRFNRMLSRKEKVDNKRCVHVAGALSISSPCLMSAWGFDQKKVRKKRGGSDD